MNGATRSSSVLLFVFLSMVCPAAFDVAEDCRPSISRIPDQGDGVNTFTTVVAFNVSDAKTPAAKLVVSGVSDNQELLPDANIQFGPIDPSNGSVRTFVFRPNSGHRGIANVTFTVTDGDGCTASTTFKVMISGGPPISPIPDQSIWKCGTAGPIPFSVSDGETFPGFLVLEKSSSNTSFVPDDNIVFSGSGMERTVTVTGATNQEGSTTITITVRDLSGQSASTHFTVQTPLVPRMVVLSPIANQTTERNMPTRAIAFSAIDTGGCNETLTIIANSSNQTLVPDTNIVIEGAGPNRAVAINPARDRIGTTTIAIIAITSGAGTSPLSATTSFILKVVGPGPPTISRIPNQTNYVNDSPDVALPFSIAGDDAEAALSRVVAQSSNQRLVPDSGITMSGTGVRRTVLVQPAADQTGTTTITISVISFDGKIASTSFIWTVIPRMPAIWNPRMTSAGQFYFDVAGAVAGKEVNIQASIDLREWVAIATNTPTTTQFQFENPATNRVHRFFRALIMP